MSVIAFPAQHRSNAKTATPPPAGPTADEGLDLIQAFMNIEDRERRAHLVRLAKRFAGQKMPTSS